jgi:hypothetical protein
MEFIMRFPHHILMTVCFGSLTALISVSGCAVANNAIRSDFADYNAIIQYTQSQQMLLNIVRMHFCETPLFLQAGGLTASYESTVGGNGGGSNGQQPGMTFTYAFGLTYQFSTKPVITYTPVDGAAYVQQYMSEVSPETFLLLLRSGWEIDKLASILFEKITLESGEVLVNQPTATNYLKEKDFFRSWRAAQIAGLLSVSIGEKGSLVFQDGKQTVHIASYQLRSIMMIMSDLAQNTDTPQEQSDLVEFGDKNNEIRIRATKARLDDSMVSVEFAGYQYSVSSSDIQSKNTLSLLMQLSRIQAAPVAPSPVLTIPVRS